MSGRARVTRGNRLPLPCGVVAAIALVVTLAASAAHASTVLETDVATMARGAALIFEGRVVASQARRAPGERFIRTYVTFEILDVLKGAAPGPRIELSFLGGSLDGRVQKVGDVEPPAVGEHGIYFVVDPDRPLVNPLYGWAQGHFVVAEDEGGTARVLTRARAPVEAIEVAPVVRERAISRGIARGVRIAGTRKGALDVPTFKQRIRSLMR